MLTQEERIRLIHANRTALLDHVFDELCHKLPALSAEQLEDDIVAMVPKLLGVAAVPATVVNWGGNDAVSIEEWCGYLSELTGLPVNFAPTDKTIDSVQIDLTRMHELIGPSTVPWRDGFRRMVAARYPDLLK